jgi:hypothetical protein
MPLSFFAMMDSVMARRAPVRCDKWRSGVSAPGRYARIMSVFAAVVKKRCGAKLKMTQHQPLMDHKEPSLAAAYPDAELGEKQLSFGRVFVFFKERFVNRLDKSICYQSIKACVLSASKFADRFTLHPDTRSQRIASSSLVMMTASVI